MLPPLKIYISNILCAHTVLDCLSCCNAGPKQTTSAHPQRVNHKINQKTSGCQTTSVRPQGVNQRVCATTTATTTTNTTISISTTGSTTPRGATPRATFFRGTGSSVRIALWGLVEVVRTSTLSSQRQHGSVGVCVHVCLLSCTSLGALLVIVVPVLSLIHI